MPDMPSKRSKKRIVKEGVRRLLEQPDWNPQNFLAGRDVEQGQAELGAAAKQERIFNEASTCSACKDAQDASGDASALCEHHLAEAMGFPED